MALLTHAQRDALLDNGRRQSLLKGTADELDFSPVVKLFLPGGGATWLLTELDPDEPDLAFGLCDLGMGFPELGYVDLAEIESVAGPLGLAVEVDAVFRATMTLSAYAADARRYGAIRA